MKTINSSFYSLIAFTLLCSSSFAATEREDRTKGCIANFERLVEVQGIKNIARIVAYQKRIKGRGGKTYLSENERIYVVELSAEADKELKEEIYEFYLGELREKYELARHDGWVSGDIPKPHLIELEDIFDPVITRNRRPHILGTLGYGLGFAASVGVLFASAYLIADVASPGDAIDRYFHGLMSIPQLALGVAGFISGGVGAIGMFKAVSDEMDKLLLGGSYPVGSNVRAAVIITPFDDEDLSRALSNALFEAGYENRGLYTHHPAK
jgi:hypothetical protein